MERDYMPKFKVRLIRAEKTIKNTYTEAELKLLLVKPDVKKCNFAEYRNWVVSNYLLGTGNRLGTICELKISDIDFVNHEILLRKLKSRRQYVIPLSVRLEKILLDYLLYRKGGADDFLFCNRCGGKMEKSSLATAIKRYNRERGVEKTSIHLYRHTFAKNWILNGGDIFRLKSILGHSSIDIVKEYAEMFGSDLKRNFDRFNPLDNFGEQKESGRQSIKMSKNVD
jgi:integrase/recombinase XerD